MMAEVVLSEREGAVLAALLTLILPSTSGPGAAEAHAVDYVLRRLAGPLAGRVTELRLLLRRAEGHEAEELAELERAEDPWFKELRALAWEGFLCDPSLGGNRGGTGWARFGTRVSQKATR